MTTIVIFFNLFVVVGFLAAVCDHYLVGQGRILRPLRALLLGCFIFSESYLAVSNPVIWLFVALSFWGLLNLFFGKRFAPLIRRIRNHK